MPRRLRALAVLALLCGAAVRAHAADISGQVTVSGVPVPGATVTAARGDQQARVLTDEGGAFRLTDLADGTWTLTVEMLGFAPSTTDAATGPTVVPIALTLRGFADLVNSGVTARANTIEATPLPTTTAPPARGAGAAGQPAPAPTPAAPADASPDLAAAAADGFLVNGSVNNGASTPFAQAAAFGNNRNLRRSLYNGMFGGVVGNSAWDSRQYSFTGGDAPKPSYNDLQLLATFGGPIPTRGSFATRPNLFAGYQRSIDNAASSQSGIVPTALERVGDFSQSVAANGAPIAPIDPRSGLPFPDGRIPADRLSPEAQALAALYPSPNTAGTGRANYQAATVTRTERQGFQTRITQNPNPRNQLLGNVQFQDIRTKATSLLGFTSATGASTLDANGTWSRRFSPFFTSRVRYQFTRNASFATPYFANRADVSGQAGIGGVDRASENWGPPSLTFASGILPLTDVQYTDTSTRTHGVTGEAFVNRQRHALTLGGTVRRVMLDSLGQQNGRGAFGFTGSATGSDLADFLLGQPRTASLALGNADKVLRANAIDAYVTDDWRVTPGLTINAGVRWEYEGPFSEKLGRLSNLDVSSDFARAGLVTPANATGAVTGDRYPSGLLRADRSAIQPRIGVAWRPIAGSSLVLRGGYGIYRNTGTYQPIALLLAQQPPFSNALSLASTPSAPLTLRDGLLASATSPSTFAVDPNFRVGRAHNWQLIAQRDLPASLTMSAGYLGTYGQNLMLQFLPNTYPAGAASPCATCPVGFTYLTSNGSSVRHAGQFQLRRRLRNGLQASGQYTFSHATDNATAFTGAALTGSATAQDWRDLDAERGPSSFNQRHLFTADVQYTTGVGVTGGGLLTGVKGALVKGWTFTSQMTAGSGFPLTPTYLGLLPGTGVTGSLRASVTGASTQAPAGYYLNPAAYIAPASGAWGNAGRNSAVGPSQFSLSAGVSRTFPWGDRANLDWRLDATNVVNVVTYSSINAVVGSPQFGLPTRANPMRKIQTTVRLRF